jgi:hypothetical protein
MEIVRACVRDGEGGSPTVVVPEGSFTDEERRALPTAAGTCDRLGLLGCYRYHDRLALHHGRGRRLGVVIALMVSVVR